MWRGVSESLLGEDLFTNEKAEERWEAQTLAEWGASGSGSCWRLRGCQWRGGEHPQQMLPPCQFGHHLPVLKTLLALSTFHGWPRDYAFLRATSRLESKGPALSAALWSSTPDNHQCDWHRHPSTLKPVHTSLRQG